MLSWISNLLAHWYNSPHVEMSLHFDTSWFWANQFSIYLWMLLSGETANTNFIVFGLTLPWLKPTIYFTQGEHAYHFTTDLDWLTVWVIKQKFKVYFFLTQKQMSPHLPSPPILFFFFKYFKSKRTLTPLYMVRSNCNKRYVNLRMVISENAKF